jgi:L-ascorbate metabolism protein UlaG (beta-lactamase superfamily)
MHADLDALLARLHWHGHDSFRLDGPPTIWFDPWKIQGRFPPADIILVSHDHHDHCSPDDVDKLRGPRTVVVAPQAAANKLGMARIMAPGDTLATRGATIQAVPAYNTNKFRAPGQLFHPRAAGHLGFLVEVDGFTIYFAGDTDFIPEMRPILCDVALLPVSGTYVMTVDEAVKAASEFCPRVVVPMHYGDIVGYDGDGAMFAASYGGRTHVLEPER